MDEKKRSPLNEDTDADTAAVNAANAAPVNGGVNTAAVNAAPVVNTAAVNDPAVNTAPVNTAPAPVNTAPAPTAVAAVNTDPMNNAANNTAPTDEAMLVDLTDEPQAQNPFLDPQNPFINTMPSTSLDDPPSRETRFNLQGIPTQQQTFQQAPSFGSTAPLGPTLFNRTFTRRTPEETVTAMYQNLDILQQNMNIIAITFDGLTKSIKNRINSKIAELNSGNISPQSINQLNRLISRKKKVDSNVRDSMMYYSEIIQDLLRLTNDYIQTYERYKFAEDEMGTSFSVQDNSYDNILQITKNYKLVSTLKRKILTNQGKLNDLVSRHNFFVTALTFGILYINGRDYVSILMPNDDDNDGLDLVKLKEQITKSFQDNNRPLDGSNLINITPLSTVPIS